MCQKSTDMHLLRSTVMWITNSSMYNHLPVSPLPPNTRWWQYKVLGKQVMKKNRKRKTTWTTLIGKVISFFFRVGGAWHGLTEVVAEGSVFISAKLEHYLKITG